MSEDTPDDFQKFSNAMDNILKADPKIVKDAMEAEKKERAESVRPSEREREKSEPMVCRDDARDSFG